jgi:hypothetical protein
MSSRSRQGSLDSWEARNMNGGASSAGCAARAVGDSSPKEVTLASGIVRVNVNVTPLFSVARYEPVIGAGLAGLERRVRAGECRQEPRRSLI